MLPNYEKVLCSLQTELLAETGHCACGHVLAVLVHRPGSDLKHHPKPY